MGPFDNLSTKFAYNFVRYSVLVGQFWLIFKYLTLLQYNYIIIIVKIGWSNKPNHANHVQIGDKLGTIT